MNRTILSKISFIMLSVLLLFGCATSGTKISKDQLAQISKGITTKQEVKNILGKPDTTSTYNGKESWKYSYNSTRMSGAGVFNAINPLPVSVGKNSSSSYQNIEITFNSKGVVEDINEFSSSD